MLHGLAAFEGLQILLQNLWLIQQSWMVLSLNNTQNNECFLVGQG